VAELVHHIEIDRAPELVFEVATDPTRFAEWRTDVTGARWVEGTPREMGATFESTRRIGGFQVTQTQRVSENDPPHRWAAVATDGPIRANATVAVEPLDDATRSRVTFTLDLRGPGIGRLMVPQARRMAAKIAPKSHRRLKELLESQDSKA
jgi:uncharacterized protein YndB with AHSA1/START domain